MHSDDRASLLNAKMSVTVSCFWAAQVILLKQLKTVYPLSCSQCSSVSSPTCLNSPGPPEKDDSDANHDDEAGKMMKIERGCDGNASETLVYAEQEVCPLGNENSTLIVIIDTWRRILRYKRHDVNVGSLISANFATAAVLISFGVVLGITSSL